MACLVACVLVLLWTVAVESVTVTSDTPVRRAAHFPRDLQQMQASEALEAEQIVPRPDAIFMLGWAKFCACGLRDAFCRPSHGRFKRKGSQVVDEDPQQASQRLNCHSGKLS